MDFVDNVIKLVKCANEKCQKERDQNKKLTDKRDIKLSNLYKQYKEGKITKDKYNSETTKIYSIHEKTEENLKFIECKIKNCFEYMKSLLLRTIFNLMKNYKDDKIKLAKLKEYKKLFNKKTIDIKDVREFYKEFK
jgi:hypothetical protein